ncbi:PH domain-containing protein [Streptomyces sp. RPA4-5]|uniref:PH domain-containing protein n=1 Tax=Streptomyces TaxID=1883 RepID=UPI00143EE151|nr:MULTISPECIES: PH domain-containing protein [Streptomyces]MCX4638330.1 PH domain-containing protein [Streptomyces platensis]QIY54466.1 PH domain-containing protein [Streptomyces sp. RPA4-5]WJY37107.1 PH domain-containing protein [Streptomyces sp. P9-2B-2]
MSAPLPSLPVTFRPTRTRVVLYSVGVAQLAALTAIALALPKLSGGERLSFVLTGLLVLAVLLLLGRPKVVARQEGVTVVNLTTRRELAWAQVVRVNLRVGDPWVHLDLADGTSLPAMGIQPGIAREQALRDARALRDLTEKHGAVDHTAG